MLRIGDSSGGWFSLARLGPMPEDWVRIQVEVGCRWFRGHFETAFLASEIEGLALGLEDLHRDQAGSFEHDAYDGDMHITFAMGKRDDLAISLRLNSQPEFLHELRLFLNVEQSALPDIVNQVRSLNEA